MNRREWLACSLWSAATWPAMSEAAVRIEGQRIPDAVTAHGNRLTLNGAGVRRRGYFKANIVALYLPERLTTAEAIYRLDGPRRIALDLLRDFSSSTISRVFISDFKQCATEAEFKQLIDVVANIGGIYGGIKSVSTGDIFNIDWIPNLGILPTHNERPLIDKPLNSPLAYQIYLRMFIGKDAPESLRNALLGLTPMNMEG